jgi:hypothetical protein
MNSGLKPVTELWMLSSELVIVLEKIVFCVAANILPVVPSTSIISLYEK